MSKLNNIWVKIGLGILIFIILIFGIRACNANKKAKEADINIIETTEEQGKKEKTEYEEEQYRLLKRFGDPGEGYRWSDDGTRMALGDPNLSETEVAYTFLRSLSTLDFATAQKYAFKDKVLSTVNLYFADDADFTYDESFKKAMYQEVLLSLEPITVKSSATFADKRANITMNVKLLDLSNKDFWKEDKDEIYSNLISYSKTEQDTTKARNYLYDYVLSYWRSEGALKKEVQLNLVLTQTPEGGWLVRVDTDLDNYAKYSDGETVINNILTSYQDYLSDLD